MKKVYLILALGALAMGCHKAEAGAKIQLRPQYYLQQSRPGLDGGVALWQHLFWRLQFNSWLGAGMKPVDTGYKAWGSANAELEVKVADKWTVATGGYFRYNPSLNEQDNSVGVKVAYRLW